MIRVLTLAGGLAGAVSLSQFPEFSQQYLQRLAGAVDELQAVVAAFDASADGFGLNRGEALAQMAGSAFQDKLRDDMQVNLVRFDRLSADYQALSGTAPLERLAMVWRMRDTELAARTWQDFRPAVPATSDGLVSAGIGFGAGWLMIAGLMGVLRRAIRTGFRRLGPRGGTPSPVAHPPAPTREGVPQGNMGEYLKTESQRQWGDDIPLTKVRKLQVQVPEEEARQGTVHAAPGRQ